MEEDVATEAPDANMAWEVKVCKGIGNIYVQAESKIGIHSM